MFKSLSSNKFARSACLLATLSIVASLTGCTQDEMDSAMAGAGVALIGAAIIDSSPAPAPRGHYECFGGSRTVCQDSRDYWGRVERVCRTQYDPCADRRWVYGLASNSMVAADDIDLAAPAAIDSAAQVNEVSVAQTFGISFDAAATILDSLNKAKSGDVQALAALGMSAEGRRSLATLQMPADAEVDAMARALNQDTGAIKAMLAKLIELGQKQQAAQSGEASVAAYMAN